MGEISRDSVGILRKSTPILMMKNKTKEMMGNPPEVNTNFDDEKQKALYESVLISTKKINELNIALEQKKDKASISVIYAEKENLSKQIEDNITKIYNLQF